jgi:hypothetical protein
MSLTVDEQTRAHLDRVRAGVGREFEHLPTGEVNRRFEAIAQQLLRDATFADFIPVLTWRYTREALRTLEGIPAEFRPTQPNSRCKPSRAERSGSIQRIGIGNLRAAQVLTTP